MAYDSGIKGNDVEVGFIDDKVRRLAMLVLGSTHLVLFFCG